MEERAIQLKSEVLKALAQPTRLKILELLRNGERCICEIVPAIKVRNQIREEMVAFLAKEGAQGK